MIVKIALCGSNQAEKAKRAKKLAEAQEKLRKMRGDTPENTPFGGVGNLLSDPGEERID